MESLEEVRRRVLYSGRVQGVGFRMTTARIARSHPVRGFVQNLPDGRVELVAVGKEDEVRRFLDAVAAHFQRNIQAQLEEEATNGEVFAAFEIRH